MSSSNKLILIDGNAIIHRAYHAMPALTSPKGEAIGAVQGFTNMLLRIIQDLKPKYLAVAWDRPEPTFRNVLFEKYQSQRPEVDRDLISQFDKVRAVLDAFDIVQYERQGFEADDIIGTLAKKAVENPKSEIRNPKQTSTSNIQDSKISQVIIVTGDKDQLQLVNEKVKVFMPVKGLSHAILYGVDEVKDKLGVLPEQVIDLKAFMGDASDNYPGVRGIGPKTAISLIEEFGGFEEVYEWLEKKSVKSIKGITSTKENKKERIKEAVVTKLLEGKTTGDISYKLARIVTDIDIPFEPEKLDDWSVGNNKTIVLFEEFGFKTLTKRVTEIGGQMADEKQGKLF